MFDKHHQVETLSHCQTARFIFTLARQDFLVMTRSLKWLRATTLLLVGLLPSALLANSVGQAVGVSQNAFLDRNGTKGYLEQGGEVVLGDVITTGATGQVQILFQDGTRIAISQNSSLVIERILFNSSGTASEFTVNAVGGAFRFLSGSSNSSAYSVRTPQATMGIRGTEFDFVISTQSGIRVATFSGEVELCNQAGQCVNIPGGCSVAGVDGSGQFIVPDGDQEEAALLANGFPYIENQNRLRRDYRTRVGGCASASTARLGNGTGPVAPATDPDPGPAPAPNNPNVGGAHAGGNTSAGFGGSTADGISAGNGGPSAPGDADASGGQASAGGAGGASAGGGGASAGGSSGP